MVLCVSEQLHEHLLEWLVSRKQLQYPLIFDEEREALELTKEELWQENRYHGSPWWRQIRC
jgi:hypothetical protein